MAADYVLALDYGDRRVGVAVAHQVARFPNALTTISNDEHLFQAVQKLVADEQAGLVVVGLPRGMDGGYTDQTRKAEAFAAELAQKIAVPVKLADETLTSVDAESQLSGTNYAKADVDAAAAAEILERYFAEQSAKGAAA